MSLSLRVVGALGAGALFVGFALAAGPHKAGAPGPGVQKTGVSSATAYFPPGCKPKTAIEFIAPMPSEEVPVFHGPSPNFDSFHIVLELSVEQRPGAITGIWEGPWIPAPGAVVFPPTDVNGDGFMGDPHPAIPGLVLTMDDDLIFNGMLIPAGTNVASMIELIGSEVEHGGDQSTTLTWILDPFQYIVVDINGDFGTNLNTSINAVTDTVFMRHGWDPIFQQNFGSQNPTLSIWTEDWISTVDSDIPPDLQTHFLVCVEARVPCYFDMATNPPTPVPLDPVFGPCQGGNMACTGNVGIAPGPGFHPMFPSLDVRFSDDYVDAMGTFVQGGTISGGACGIIWNSTGQNLAYAFSQASVHAWYGVNGIPDTTPGGGGDDQLIYRFVMIADGQIMDSDVLPQEMMITAALETQTNCFSITNVRVKHRPDVITPDPGP